MAKLEAGEHLDPTAELSLETVKKRAVSGILTLTGRTFFLQAISLIATFLLTVFLDPAQYGVFFLVSAVINFFAYFSDIGLAAALIQKKEVPSEKDLKTSFSMQQILVTGLILVIFLLTPALQRWYGLSREGVYLLWALGFSLLLSSLKTIPSVLLERRLEFSKLVIPQIVETILFYSVAVYLAWGGFGITSFTVAVLVRSVSGLIIIYILQPWVPNFAFSKGSLRELLKFGLPYQGNTFLAVVKDDGLTAVLGGILGSSGIGFLGWAQKWAQAPLRFFMDAVIKVTFPAFSRMQNHREELSKGVSRSIFFVCLLVFPVLVGLITIAQPLIQVIPKYEKWQPALIALYLFGINTAWAAVTTPLTNVLNAIGKIATTFKLMIMWTSLTWVLVPFLAINFGINGAAFGFAVVGTSSAVAIWIVRKQVKFDLFESGGKPLLAALLMGAAVLFARIFFPVSWVGVVGMILVGVAVYLVSIFVLVGHSIITDTKRIFYAFYKS